MAQLASTELCEERTYRIRGAVVSEVTFRVVDGLSCTRVSCRLGGGPWQSWPYLPRRGGYSAAQAWEAIEATPNIGERVDTEVS